MQYVVRGLVAISLIGLAAWAEKEPLTLEAANQATGYMEWVLDARFNAEQRQRYHEILAELWRGNQSSKDSITAMARAGEALPGLEENKKTQLRAAKQPEFIRLLESATDDKSRWLLGIYRTAHNAAPVQNSSALLGSWSTGHISSIQYKNSVTGVSAPTNGSRFSYEFKADGTYSFTGLMQSVMYSCTNSTFSNETGTYTVEGDAVSLRPEKNPYQMRNTCAPSSNREAPGKLIARTYRFSVNEEGGRKQLALKGEDGSAQKFSFSR